MKKTIRPIIIIIKLPKTNNKEKILKIPEEKKYQEQRNKDMDGTSCLNANMSEIEQLPFNLGIRKGRDYKGA